MRQLLVTLIALLLFVLAAAALLMISYRLARKRKVGHFSGGIGNALFQVHTLVNPTATNIVEAKKQPREEIEKGDDKPPDLPPWAQSGN